MIYNGNPRFIGSAKGPFGPFSTGGGGQPAPWTPASESLIAWFQASTYNGTTWPDSSPNGYNASLAGTGAAPTLVTNVVNGQPVVRFNAGKYFTFASGVHPINEDTPYGIVIVFKATALTMGNYYGLVTISTGASSQQFMLLQNFSTDYGLLIMGGGYGNPGGQGVGVESFDYSSDFIALEQMYNGGGDLNSIANFSARVSNIPQSIIQNVGSSNSVLGTNVIGALSTSGDGLLIGDVAEIIIPASAWDNDTLTKLNTYLYDKYAVGTNPAMWRVSDIHGLFSWHESTNVLVDSGDAFRITDLSGNGRDIDCIGYPVMGEPAPVVPNSLNGQPALDISSSKAGGGFIQPHYNDIFCDPTEPFGIAWVVHPNVLASTDLTSLCVMAGSIPDKSFTVYYALDSPILPNNLTIELAALSDPSHVGTVNDFAYSDPHWVVINYTPGTGGYYNVANFEFFINGSPVAIEQQALPGSNDNFNWLGNHGDPPHLGVGLWFSYVCVKNHKITGSDFSNLASYYNSKFGI